MNGATAEPSVRTMSNPNSSKTNNMGINQYFLRNLIYAQSSLIKDIKIISKLILHRADHHLSLNPIIISMFIDFFPEQTLPGGTHN